MTKQLRIGFIGGHGHHYLLPALADETLEVTAAAAPDRHDPAAARARLVVAEKSGGWFDSAEALLDGFKPDIVNVGGVYGHNAALTALALRRGVPVVAEKPIAASWDALHELEKIATAADSPPLLTEFNFRCLAPFRAAREAVRAGELGKIVLATGQKSYQFGERRPDFYRHRDDYGSTMLWVASHAIDAIRFATGLTFESVTGLQGNVAKPAYADMEDVAVATFTLRGGAPAVVHADFHRPAGAPTHGDDRLRIVGDRGQVEIRDGRCVLITREQGPRDITDDTPSEPVHRAMLRAAFEGETTYFSSASSLELARVLLKARDAADTGSSVLI